MNVKQRKEYKDLLDADYKAANEMEKEHRAQIEFHTKQYEYWKLQCESLSAIKFRVAADNARDDI